MSALEKIQNYRKYLGLPPTELVQPMYTSEELLRMPNKEFLAAILDDIPGWRRGLSVFQYTAFDDLLLALRDDLLQGTVYRVRALLNEIGIKTNFPKSELSEYIILSRGNDLAFLWILCTGRHGYPPKQKYNMEEQLLMSGISHLDAIATLRALDRILPPGHKAAKNKYKIKRELDLKLYTKLYKKKKTFYNYPHANPIYLQPHTLPVPFGKTLIATCPDFQTHLGFYENYKDKNYIVPNAKNRWFSNNKLKTQANVQPIPNEKYVKTLLCLDKYRAIRDVEISLEQKLNEIVLNYSNKCEKNSYTKRGDKIKAELEEAVTCHLQDFRKCSDKMRLRPLIDLLTCHCEQDSKDSNEQTTTENYVANEGLISEQTANSATVNDCLKTSNDSQTFFTAPKADWPYSFDYAKIYNFQSNDDENYLQHMMNATLWEEIELMLDNDKKMMLNNEYEKIRVQNEIIPDIAVFYDCNDRLLMRNILIAALEYLSIHDKSLLLPTLPESYKMFIFREFVARRYGKKYTERERQCMYEVSTKVIKALYDEWQDIKFPSDRPIFTVKSYKCYAFVKYFAKTWKKKYLERVEKQLMEYSRNLWASTRLAAHSFSKQGFFSYLPAKPSETRYFAF